MPNQLQHYASSIASHRVALYTSVSVGAVLAVVANALKKHSNFYSVAVYLSKSNGAVVVIANFGLLLALLAGRLLQQTFFGPLRPIEVERLYDRMWFFITESLLAFTIFRDEFDISFALMFGLLLFMKCFHWLLSDRIEWMDQRPYPGPPLLFHIRVYALASLLWITDLAVFLLTLENMYTHGVGGTVLFASEYAILLASLGNSVAKYAIALVDLRRASLRGGENAPPWEDKSMLVFYVELATDFLKLVTYLSFFMLVLTFYGLPLNIVRDVYITARSFIMRFRDLIRYRTATRNMDERYPNATEQELSNMSDRICIICREEMVHPSGDPATEGAHEHAQAPAAPQDGPNTTPKKLPCGHIFHFFCLRSWLERQQSCPTCRRSVLEGSQPTRENGQVVRPQNQPGVAPLAPNGVVPGQPFQWQPDQQGNRGGLLGRFMGVAGMPPVGHGQFLPVPLPGQAPQPNGNGLINQQELPPATLQPFQHFRPNNARGDRFAGFFTPDGVWHPWPQAHVNANNGVQNVPYAGTPEPVPMIPSSPNAENRVSQPVGPSQGAASPDGITSASASSSTTSLNTSTREAAAAAALRRLSPSSTSLTRRHGPEVTQVPVQLDAQAALGRNTGSGSNDIQPETESTNNTAGPDSSRQAAAPAYIPLFDPHISSPPLTGSLPNLLRTEQSRTFRFTRRQTNEQLSPTLTDEQLRVLDRLTREAIDERLRLLENIQTTTARCAMDLLRCRSVLPRSNTVPEAASGSPGDSTGEGTHNASEGPPTTLSQESLSQGPTADGPQPAQPVETGA